MFPLGVGFPYTNIAFDLTILEDHFVAEDAYKLWMNWLQRFETYCLILRGPKVCDGKMTAAMYNVVRQFDLFRLDEYLKKLFLEGNECLPLISGGEIASTFDNPESVKLG
ncbi:hypothetical protein P8452_27098 [Trifolium repens]|nr:hypothetical protein P8452_27098 [Trifolium repens]